jgi:predicted aspartyl protease
MTVTILTLLLAQSPQALTSPVECPFKVTEDAIIVDAVVNGKTISCMFDTGYGGHFVINDAINIGKPSGVAGLRDFVGTFEAKTVKIDSIRLGDLVINDPHADAVQLPMAHMSVSYGTHTDAIMGLSVVKDYVTEINIEKQKFIFHPRSVDITKRVPDNERTFLVKMKPYGYNSIELPVTVNGHPLHLALDTGNSFYTTTHKESLIRIGLWDKDRKPNFMTQAMVASGPVDSFMVRMPEAQIFGVTVKESIWDVIDLPSSGADADGTVGFGFLKHFNIIIDYERRYVWLENWTGRFTDRPKAHVGFRVYQAENGDYIVYGVFKGGPAEAAGIQRGDRLRVIDGKSVSMMRPEQVEAALTGEEGSICRVAVSRGGLLIRADVERKLLVN